MQTATENVAAAESETKFLSFPELMRQRARELRAGYDDAHYRLVSDYVTLVQRNRGRYLGAMRSDRRNHWNDLDSRFSKGFVTYPVIPRAIRAKLSTAVSTDIRLECKPALRTPEKEAAAEVCNNIYKHFADNVWTERVEAMCALLGQLGRFTAVLIEPDDENTLKVAEKETYKKEWLSVQDQTFGCMKCGATYTADQLGLADNADAPDEDVLDSEIVDDEPTDEANAAPNEMPSFNEQDEPADETIPPRPAAQNFDLSQAACLNLKCGAGTIGPHDDADYELHEVPTGETETVRASKFKTATVPSLLIRYDDLHTIGFDWQKAHWFNYHPLVPRYEILADYPELEDTLAKSGYDKWSESARWYYELARSEGNLGSSSSFGASRLNQLVEKDFWFYEKPMCHNWRQPDADWFLKKNGKIVFTIKKGETIQKALERESGEEFRGCLVEMCGDEVLNVRNQSFRDSFALVGWQPDAASHVPMGEERLIPLQDAATRVLSMVYSGVQKMTNPKGVVDSRLFNRKDLTDNQPGAWIATKPNKDLDERGSGILSHVGYITPPNPSSLVDMFISLVIQIAKEESGIFDETVGAVNSGNQTARGREMALNQSLGLMTPTQKSKKSGKIAALQVYLKLWQQMPDEAFVLIKGTFEEEWKPQDIEAFKSLEIENEIAVSAVDGSDVPQTRTDLMNNIMLAANLGLLGEQSPFDAETTTYILRLLGIDLDIGNLAADRRLAARRHEFMREIVGEAASNNPAGYAGCIVIEPDALTGLPTRKLHNDIRLMIAQDLRTKVRQEDDHAAFVGYYIDQIKGFSGSREPSEIELLILETAIDNHNLMTNQTSANVMKSDLLAKSSAGLATADGAQPTDAQPPVDESGAPPTPEPAALM